MSLHALKLSRPTRLRPALTGLAVALLAAGCTTTPVERQNDLSAKAQSHEAYVASSPKAAAPARYRLQVGDILDLRFRRTDEVNDIANVRPDGLISLRWVGEVQAAGLTPAELAAQIEKSYAEVLTDPKVDVIVRSFQPSRVYVGGEVVRPGELQLSGSLSALQAIVRAGDFGPDARRDSIIVIRQNGAAEPEYILLDFGNSAENRLAEARKKPCSPENPLACDGMKVLRPEGFVLEPLDVVFVPKTRIAGVAQFFDRYINQIVPMWRNFGLSLTYLISRDRTSITTTTP